MNTGRRKRKDRAIRFYEKVVEKSPHFVEALSCLAAAYTKKGFYREGLSIDKRLSLFRPNDPVVFYNLACSYSLVGDVFQSLEALKKAFALGYRDLSHLFDDPDLEQVRKHPLFNSLLEKINEGAAKR